MYNYRKISICRKKYIKLIVLVDFKPKRAYNINIVTKVTKYMKGGSGYDRR